MKARSLVGQQFGRLYVLDQYVVKYRTYQDSICICLCDCGTIKQFRRTNIKNNTSSCGCLQRELLSDRRKPNKLAIVRAIWNYYKRNAKTRDLSWNLSYKKFKELISSSCYYCGIINFSETKNTQTKEILKHNGIDRKNNKLGYSNKNCVSCCRVCNLGKNNLSEIKFNKWLTHIKGQING